MGCSTLLVSVMSTFLAQYDLVSNGVSASGKDRHLIWPRDYSQFLQAHILDAAFNVAVALTSRWRCAVLGRCWL